MCPDCEKSFGSGAPVRTDSASALAGQIQGPSDASHPSKSTGESGDLPVDNPFSSVRLARKNHPLGEAIRQSPNGLESS